MAQFVDSNFFVSNRCVSAVALLNAGSRLRLFQAAHVPSPADVLGTYTAIECNFDSYLIQVLTALWAAPVKVQDGEYASLGPVVTYASPGAVGNTIFGLFVDDGGGNLLFAEQFDSNIIFTTGSPALQLQLQYQVWAKSIIP